MEILNVKNEGSDREWCKKVIRHEDELWEEDEVRQIRGVGKTSVEKLKRAGIYYVKDLKYLDDTDETMFGISEGTKLNGENGLTVSFIRSIVDICRDAAQGEGPKAIDHQLAVNPYRSKFGDDWFEKVKKSTHMKKYVSIRSLVTHIYEETKSAFVGTVHENDFYFYHDALSLMSSKKTWSGWIKKIY